MLHEKATYAVLSLSYLERVRDRIADPACWVEKSTRALTAAGDPCDATAADAVAWSLPAALERERYRDERGFLGRRKLVEVVPEQSFLMAYVTLGRQAFDRLDEVHRATAMIGGDAFQPQRGATPQRISEYAIFQYTTMNAEGHARALEILDAAIERTRTEGPDERALGEEFPIWFVQECRERYPRPAGEEAERFAAATRTNTGGRSYPTDYPAWSGDVTDAAQVTAHIAAVREQLGPVDEARARTADYRAWYGPGPADVEALPHIEDAYYVAFGVLERAQLLTGEPWTNMPAAPSLLDLVVRNVAQRMARDREGLELEDAQRRYGWDPYRVALEHGQAYGLLDALMAQTGLRASGTTCPEP